MGEPPTEPPAAATTSAPAAIPSGEYCGVALSVIEIDLHFDAASMTFDLRAPVMSLEVEDIPFEVDGSGKLDVDYEFPALVAAIGAQDTNPFDFTYDHAT